MRKPQNYPAIARWLHRRGIARTVQSCFGGDHHDVRYLMDARSWTPGWLVVWAARQNLLRCYSSSAGRLYLAEVRSLPVAVDGTRRWELHWWPAR